MDKSTMIPLPSYSSLLFLTGVDLNTHKLLRNFSADLDPADASYTAGSRYR